MQSCDTLNCTKPAKAHGLCGHHYGQQHHSGYMAPSVVYRDDAGKIHYGPVPRERQCRGCRGWASHFWDSCTSESASAQRRYSARKAGREVRHGYAICLDCVRLWRSFGRSGVVREMEK